MIPGGLVNLTLSSACNRPSSFIDTLSVCGHRQTLEPDQWSRLAGCLAAVMLLLLWRGFHVPSGNTRHQCGPSLTLC
jgi:hypothetical protein